MPVHVVLDCEDPETLAPFWCELLGVKVLSIYEDGRHVILAPTKEGFVIGLQQVPEPKVGKNRMHVDVMVEDLDEDTAKAQALGGRWAEPGITHHLEGFEGFLWRCLLDPEGNEFCIYTRPAT
jgi:predicted enzyme related to lactoylglutathione lyase